MNKAYNGSGSFNPNGRFRNWVTPLPSLSIVIPTHRRPALLRRAILSVKAQSVPGVQTIVVSDEPCTDTFRITSALLKGDDLFLQRFGETGPAESRNLGAEAASGDFVIFLDDDDALSPRYLETASKAAARDKVIFTDWLDIGEKQEGNLLRVSSIRYRIAAGQPLENLWVKNFIPFSALVFPADAARDRKADPSLPEGEDWDFTLNVARDDPLEHASFLGPMIHARQTADNRSRTDPGRHPKMYRLIYSRHPAPNTGVQAARTALFRSLGLTLD